MSKLQLARLELVAAAVAGFLAILTLITREWIEIVFGVDPDNGSGALEWAIVVGFALASVALSVLGTRTRRAALAAS